jgi:hypothetical protein
MLTLVIRAPVLALGCVLAAGLSHPRSAQAQVPTPPTDIGNVVGSALRHQANGVLSMLSYTVLPGAAASSVELQPAGSAHPALSLGQFGDGTTLSESFPLFVEGFIGYSRYSPRVVFANPDGRTFTEVGGKWNSLAANGGVGWDFKLSEHWVLRPIITASLGLVASDAALAGAYLNTKYNADLAFLERGTMNAAGAGASLVLGYYLKRPEYEIDFETRSTNGYMQTIGGTSSAVQGSAVSNAISTWERVRWPTGMDLFGRPLRYVLEQENSWYFDEQAKSLGFSTLHSIGAGLEFDTSAHEIGVWGFNMTRMRLVGRYFFGPNVTGYSVGIGISF